MRLFLHGKSTPSILSNQLQQVREERIAINTLWLSQWDFDSMEKFHPTLVQELIDLVTGNDITTTSNNVGSTSSSSAFVLDRVIVQNCYGTNKPSHLWSILLRHTKQLTIRYDLQQDTWRLPSVTTSKTVYPVDNHDETDSTTTIPTTTSSKYPLEDLELVGLTLTTQCLVQIEEICTHWMTQLHRLSISGSWTNIDIDRYHSSILGLESQVPTNLSSLCRILSSQTPTFSNLHTLEFINCHLVDSCLAEILRHVLIPSSSLSVLNLSGNMAKEKTLKVIRECLIQPNCTLSHLDLGWQRQYHSNMQNGASLHQHQHHHGMGRFSNRMMEYLVEGLERNHSIQTLNLAKNYLGSTMMTTKNDIATTTTTAATALYSSEPRSLLLWKSLHLHHTIRYLDLQDCGLTSTDVRYLARMLPQIRLYSLNLSGQQSMSGNKMKQALLASLSENLYLSDIRLPHIESQSMEWWLEWNRIGRRAILPPAERKMTTKMNNKDDVLPLSMEEPLCTPNLLPTLLERANRICFRGHPNENNDQTATRHAASAIYYLLRQGGCNLLTSSSTTTMAQEDGETNLSHDQSPPHDGSRPRSTLQRRETTSLHSQILVTPMIHNSGDIELNLVQQGLEESSSFSIHDDNDNKRFTNLLTIDVTEPSCFLERPQLTSTRVSTMSQKEDNRPVGMLRQLTQKSAE